MKLALRMLMVFAILAVTAGMASADAATRRADRRQANQHVRIAQGVHSGQLTRAEAKRLRAGQRRIRRMERRSKADCVVTRAEHRRIGRALDRQSRAIYRLKHNRQAR